MFTNIPQLKMFVIDFEEREKTEKEIGKIVKGVVGVAKAGAALIPQPAVSKGVSLTADVAGVFFGEEAIKLKRLVDENRFYIIKTPEELQTYQNAQGNEWVTEQKLLKKKQYYIQHPKRAKGNILIESKSFCEYIEDEQKEELIDFILSHCRAKSILIERLEDEKSFLGIKAKVEEIDAEVGADHGKRKGEFFSLTSKRRMRKKKPREEYLWLDEWAKETIASLKKGARFEQVYVNDFSFGLIGEEASILGLKFGKSKQQRYRLVIEC